MTAGSPDAEVDIDEALVQALLKDQHPDLAGLPLRFLDRGWDNVMYRLGGDHLLRLPRRDVAAQLLVNEQQWLGKLESRLPISIPAPVRVGQPGQGFPWRWSVLPWFNGDAADLNPPDPDQALRLADFLKALHQDAPLDAPANDVRGVPLSDRTKSFEERTTRLRTKSDLLSDDFMFLWADALAAPVSTDAKWLHGDLHARNIVVEAGEITGIIDWGDITSGDVATDLSTFWMLFDDPDVRQRALSRYGASAEEILRAKGWALLFGVILLDTGLINFPRHVPMGKKTLLNLRSV